MTTFNTPLGDLDGARLQALVDAGLREGRQFEFKRQLPGGSDDEKREFLADVSSFANVAGGDLVYGLSERLEGGKPTGEVEAIVGLAGVQLDPERLRLESTIRTGVDPRLAVQLLDIRRNPEPPCLLIRVPRSWSGLHMVTFKKWSRFFGRTSAGKYPLDVREIGRGFVGAAMARERASAFRTERLTRIIGGAAPIALSDAQKAIVHAIPLEPVESAWSTFQTAKADTVARALCQGLRDVLLSGLGSFDWAPAYNLDGFLVRSTLRNAQYNSYIQLYRNGGLEAVAVDDFALRHVNDRLIFSGSAVESAVLAIARAFQAVWCELSMTGPVALGVTLAGLPVGAGMVLDSPTRLPAVSLDRDPLVLPEIVVDDLEAKVETVLRPIFDVLWNVGGLPRSPNYEGDSWSRH